MSDNSKENMFRADISPMDAANGRITLQKLKPGLKSLSDIGNVRDPAYPRRIASNKHPS